MKQAEEAKSMPQLTPPPQQFMNAREPSPPPPLNGVPAPLHEEVKKEEKKIELTTPAFAPQNTVEENIQPPSIPEEKVPSEQHHTKDNVTTHQPITSSHIVQEIPRIPIPETVEPEYISHQTAGQMPIQSSIQQPIAVPSYPQAHNLGFPQAPPPQHLQPQGQPQMTNANNGQKMYKPSSGTPEMYNQYGQSMPTAPQQQTFQGQQTSPQLQMGLLNQLAQIQQQQLQLQNLLNTYGIVPQSNMGMQMMNPYMQNQFKMNFPQGASLGCPQMTGMQRPMGPMMGADMQQQYAGFTGAAQQPRMMMPQYATSQTSQMIRPENTNPQQVPSAQYSSVQRVQYPPQENPYQHSPPQNEPIAPQAQPKENMHNSLGLTPTKPIPQHPKTPSKIPTRSSPIPKRAGGLDSLIKVAVESEKKGGKHLQGPQSNAKTTVVSIPFSQQVQPGSSSLEEDQMEQRRQAKSTLVKLAMSSSKKSN